MGEPYLMSQSRWHDSKRYLWLLGLVIPALVLVGIGMHAVTGWGVWCWIGPIVVLGIVPVIDLVTGLDPSNPPDHVIESLEKDRYYRWITFLFLPVQYLGVVVAMWVIARGDLAMLEKVGLAVTLGFTAGVAINIAHELGHKRESHERWLSKIALAQTFYGHFYTEHNRGHHVRVATPEDPASSRFGESFYRFWGRTVGGSVRNAWRVEDRRLSRRHRHPVRLGNDVLNAWLMSAVLWAGLVLWLGPGILPYLLVQALVGITLLEAVNYLEHYGLLRRRVGVGEHERYERVDATHSWNSNNVATNVLLYHLQRHSDHHANPTRRYQSLRDLPQAPVLPTGYAGMILLALVPPLWRRVMDRRVLAHVDGDITRVNVCPRRRRSVLREHSRSSSPVLPRAAACAPAEVPVEVLAARCPTCGYTYTVEAGDEREGFAAGTPWAQVPTDWPCPDCGVCDKVDFLPLTVQDSTA